jgi:hypothetical protein
MAVPTWMSDVESTYINDNKCTQLVQELAINAASHTNYTLHQGILRYKNRIVIGTATDLKDKLFHSFPSSIFGGHSGSRVTYHRLKHLFFWPNMKQFVADKVSTCPVCQISKTERVQYPGLLDPLPVPMKKWTDISLDFVEGLPKSKGKDVILVVVDRLTKYAHFIPMSHPYTTHQVAQLFLDNIVKLHGTPETIVSDRDRIFTSKLWHDIFSALKVKLNFSSAYHPESDGQSERVNQCLEQYLRSMAFAEPQNWASWLPAAELWYNTSYHTSIKTTPFEALYEYAPPHISQLSIPCDLSPEATVTLKEQDHMLKHLQQNLLQAQNRMKKFADNNRSERQFSEGDMVYLKMQPYRENALGLRNALKLTSKFYGPFRVMKRIGRVAYKLQLPAGTLLHDVFHVNQLKRHLGPAAVPNAKLPLLTPDGKVKTAPLAILQYRQVPRNAGEYDIPVPPMAHPLGEHVSRRRHMGRRRFHPCYVSQFPSLKSGVHGEALSGPELNCPDASTSL